MHLSRFLENRAILSDFGAQPFSNYDLSTIVNAWTHSGKSSEVDLQISQLNFEGKKFYKENNTLEFCNLDSILNYVADQHENKLTLKLSM